MKAGRMSCLLKYQKYNRKIDIIEELGSVMFETERDLWICEETIRNSSRISLERITGKCSPSAQEWEMVCGVDAGWKIQTGIRRRYDWWENIIKDIRDVTAQPIYKVFAVISKHYTEDKYSNLAKRTRVLSWKNIIFQKQEKIW